MLKFGMPSIGHNSVQIPHDGKLVQGATFKKKVFRPTAMSLALAKVGLIPGAHIIDELARTAVVRNRNDNYNERPSVRIAL